MSDLTVTGNVTATTIRLTGADVAIPSGTVSDGGAGSTTLVATSGSLVGIGSLVVGTLSGSAATAVSLTGTNPIATLGSFTATHGFTMHDSAALAVNGPVNAGSVATIIDTASLSVPGSLTATSIYLSGANLAIGGSVSDQGAGTTTLIATAGTIGETGSLLVGSLAGSSTGATSLTASNTIAALGSFTADGFTLHDGTALTVNGPLNGGASVAIVDTGLLSVPGASARRRSA